MKPSSAALRSLLASRQFFAADLYTFTLAGGGVLRYCGGDTGLSANGFSYAAGGTTGPYFDRKDNKAKCHWKIGVSVDTLVFDVIPGGATVLGEPFLSAVHNGLFDGAELTLERAYMPNYGAVAAGTVIYFVGRVAEIDASRSIATFSVNSHLELADLQLPRNLFQSGCINNLGDTSCTVNLSSYGVAGNAASGSTANIVNATVNNALAGYFDQGKIVFAGGANSGLSRTVKQCVFGAPGTITLLAPFPVAPAAGDAFTLYPGCDKSLGPNGCPKFNNNANFRGFPYVPSPETAL